ncbi:MAG: hypothetical protein AABZ30_06160, partial [Myxococcota bacterium]
MEMRLVVMLALCGIAGGCGRTSFFPCAGNDDCGDGEGWPWGGGGEGEGEGEGDGGRTDPDGGVDIIPKVFKDCTGGGDDDGDGLVDCDDPDCAGQASCVTPGIEICANGVDDDQDDATDCDDVECAGQPVCAPGAEICGNGVDDDGDGATDCNDPDCQELPECAAAGCTVEADLGDLAAVGGSVSGTLTTDGQADDRASGCGPPGGGDVVARFDLLGDADVRLELAQTGDHVIAIFAAGFGQDCDANPIACFDPEGAASATHTLLGLPEGTYFVLADAYVAGLEGAVDLTLSTGSPETPELCTNGADDDGDGAVDCNDLDCQDEASCLPLLCEEDENLGVLVAGGESKSTTVFTSTGGNDQELLCSQGGGGDRVIRFVLLEVAGVLVEFWQSGEHSIGLFLADAPATPCEL